jgi:hypothetical protein
MSRTPLTDQRRVSPSFDTERVLGQIERGELRCGPDAAREIAARAEEQYGAAFGRRTDDAAWADAVTSLNGGTA